MIKITFPDGSVREYQSGVTGLQIAESISPALARNVVSCGVNDETTELNRPITTDSTIALYRFEDAEGKHSFWHTSAHLLAEALKELYPGIQFGFGPAVENGFFYDVMPKKGDVISENDFPKIEAKMMELARKNELVVRKEVSKADAIAQFTADGQAYKVEHIDQDLEDGTITTYTQGCFTDLCKGPHLVSTGLIKAVKIMSAAGAFWRGDANR
ncbi:MAG: TGS domain-containing protein, partial [Bacteroidaceae bacterium]